MSDTIKSTVEIALGSIKVPETGQSLKEAGILGAVVVDGGKVGVILDFGATSPKDTDALRAAVEKTALSIKGVTEANAIVTAMRKPSGPKQSGPGKTPPPTPTKIPGVRHIIAVASGKGGVGKSTTSVNLAVALRDKGLKVGILDADIFGPSLPMLLGTSERPDIKDKVIQPVIAHGMKVMSIGFLIDVDQPVVWRGPRVMGATQQLLREVAWGPLDVLIVDMPPGTGDVQLTMVQQAPLTGAVIVSTPQDLALIDARKGLAMFRKVNVPILGIVENMSTFHCPKCGHESHIFGHGGAEETAAELGCDFLGGIPLHISVRELADGGTPIVAADPTSTVANAYGTIAEKVAAHITA